MTQPRLYAIGDVHGHLDKLTEAHRLIAADSRGVPSKIIHIGDLTDRGPDSRGVLDFLIGGIESGADWVVRPPNC